MSILGILTKKFEIAAPNKGLTKTTLSQYCRLSVAYSVSRLSVAYSFSVLGSGSGNPWSASCLVGS